MNSDAKQQRNKLREIEKKLFECYEHISESFGLQGLKAKLVSVLFISVREPRSLTELAELTHFSKPSISRTMRELEVEAPFIVSVKKPQDKEKYYKIEVEFLDIIMGFLGKALEDEAIPTLEGTSEAIESLERLQKEVDNPAIREEIDAFLDRTMLVNRTYKKYLWIIEKMIVMIEDLEKEYEATHPDE